MGLESAQEIDIGQELRPDEVEEIEAITKRIIELEKGPLKPEQKSALEKIRTRIERFTIRTAQISLLLSAAFGMNYKRTHQDIETINHQGTESYQHPDEETTHILNYIAGKESLTDEERIGLARGEIKGFAEREKKDLPTNFETMSLEETRVWFLASFSESLKNSEVGIDDYFNVLVSNPKVRAKLPEDNSVYKAIWSMQKEVGAPRIRWYKGASALSRYFAKGSAHYLPNENTLYITMANPREELFAEAAHAKQFNDDQAGSYLKEIQRLSSIAKEVLVSGESLQSVYQKEYETPGTVEHDAHKVIEPYLVEKYGQKKAGKK